jgi:hypothetical protein
MPSGIAAYNYAVRLNWQASRCIHFPNQQALPFATFAVFERAMFNCEYAPHMHWMLE